MVLQPLPVVTESDGAEKYAESSFPYADLQAHDVATAQNPPIFSPLHSSPVDREPEASEKQRMDELEKMLSEAQSRAAVIEQEAYDKAYAAGEKSGMELGKKRAEQMLQGLHSVLDSARLELQLLQQQSLDAVMDICDAVLHHIMNQQPDKSHILQAGVKQAIGQLGVNAGDRLVLLIHPQDMGMFEKMRDVLGDIPFQGSTDVAVGTCRLMSAEQDSLIDPGQMIAHALTHVREQLQAAARQEGKA